MCVLSISLHSSYSSLDHQWQLQNQRTSTRWVFRELLGSEDVFELFPNHIRIYPPKVTVPNPTAFNLPESSRTMFSGWTLNTLLIWIKNVECTMCITNFIYWDLVQEDGPLREWKKQLLNDKEISYAKQIFNSYERSAFLVCFYLGINYFRLKSYWQLGLSSCSLFRRSWKQTTWIVRSFKRWICWVSTFQEPVRLFGTSSDLLPVVENSPVRYSRISNRKSNRITIGRV
jgi:hypothetical protein